MIVKINNIPFNINETDQVEINNKLCLGATKYVDQEIVLLKSLSKIQKKLTLKHELTHAFLWAYGFSGLNDTLPLEVVCDFVAIYSEQINNICEQYFRR